MYAPMKKTMPPAGRAAERFVIPMVKRPFVTLQQAKAIAADIPTPFHLYDEHGIRENARKLKQAFAWNKGYREYFAVKATPAKPSRLNQMPSEPCSDCASKALTAALRRQCATTRPARTAGRRTTRGCSIYMCEYNV